MNRKGILFTAGFLAFGLVILSLSFILFLHTTEEKSDVGRMMLFDRIDDEINAAEKMFRNIVEKVVNITVNGNVVTLRESLPNPSSVSFSSDIDVVENFIENNSALHMKLNMADVKSTLPLYINGIRYYHDQGFGQNSITITNASNVTRYNLYIQIAENGTIDPVWSEQSGSDIFYLYVRTVNDIYEDTKYLDFSQLSTLRMGIGSDDVNIDIGSSGYLRVENVDAIDMVLTTSFTINTNDMLMVMFPKQSINITLQEYSISKMGAIRVG